jgi:hypothetical protein
MRLALLQPLRHPQVLLQDRHVARGERLHVGVAPFCASAWYTRRSSWWSCTMARA